MAAFVVRVRLIDHPNGFGPILWHGPLSGIPPPQVAPVRPALPR
jgi:hypothetical protein